MISQVLGFAELLPLLEALRSPFLLRRHWRQLGQALGVPDLTPETASLSSLIQAGALQEMARLTTLADCAQQESALENRLQAMQDEWAQVKFTVTVRDGLEVCPRGARGVVTRLATSICHLRHDQMQQGPTEPHAGRSTFLLSSGGAVGGYY